MAAGRIPASRALVITISAIAVIVLAAVLGDILRRGLSELVAQEARYNFGRVGAAGVPADQDAFESIRAEFDKALALAPDNPQLHEDLGRLSEARAGRMAADRSSARDFREQSLRHYRRAVVARPSSPHAHLGLALLKLELGEVDREFSFFLGRALEFGPWEPQLQLMAIHLGLVAWQGLSAATQEQIRKAIRNQMSWVQVDQRAAVRKLLGQFRRNDLLPAATSGR